MEAAGKYKMSTVVGLTGISELVLRAWERRYGILHPQRGQGGQRLYTDEDVAVLRAIREELSQGRSIGEVAAAGREALLGGRGREQPGVPPAFFEEIVDAVAALDRPRLDRALDRTFAALSPAAAIDEVLLPAARDIGERWAAGTLGVAAEHMASAAFMLRARKLFDAADGRAAGKPVLVACFPDERHELGPILLAWRIAQRGIPVVWFGAALPFEDLDRAIGVLAPKAVCLSVTRAALYQTHKPELLILLRRRAAKASFVIGGQGAPEQDDEVAAAGGTLGRSAAMPL